MNSTVLSSPNFDLLLEAVYNAIEKGNQVHPDSSLDIDKRYNTAYILRISKSLNLLEISALLNLSNQREQGLSLLRKGDLSTGAALLKAAGETDVELSEEARLLLETFQTAAEAFLHFKLTNYDQATSLLYQAIRSLEKLHDDHGHEAEVRRIHLARNLVHVLSHAGRGKEAILLNCRLFEYLTGSKPWPIPSVTTCDPLEKISQQEKVMLAGQLLAEMDYLLINPPFLRQEMSKICIDLVQVISAHPSLQVVAYALATQHALFLGQEQLFLECALSFFSSKDAQYLPGVRKLLIYKLYPHY